MTAREFIETMMAECRRERGEIEDFLNAMKDVVIERLNGKENVVIKGLGAFEFVDGAERPVRFRFAREIYPQLGIRPKNNLDKCVICGEGKPIAGLRKCQKCKAAQERTARQAKRAAAIKS